MGLVIPDFDFRLSDEEIDKISLIHNNDMINLCDKKFIYSIISFISGKNILSESNDSNIRLFLDFCLREDVYLSNNFTLILNRIDDEIKKINNRFHSFEEKDALKKKIMLYILSGVKDRDCFKMLNSLLNSDIKNINPKFIIDLFKNKKLSGNIEKRNIIFNILLESKIDISILLNEELYNSFWSLLSNDNILSLDKKEFGEFVRFSLTNINAYILADFLNISNDKKKNKLIIDYIYNILINHPYKTPLVDNGALKNSLSLKPFSIINSIIECSYGKFKNILDTIKSSKRFISTSIVLSRLNLEDERKEFALSLIENSSIKEEINPNMNIEYYKYALSFVSISPLLEKLTFKQYKRILIMIDEYIKNLKKPNNDILQCIVKFLNNPNFINIDYLDLRYILYMIITSNSKELANFLNNDILIYYTTSEYVRVLNIIKDNLSSNTLTIIERLFTNNNLSYMTKEEKQIMFEYAWSGDVNLTVSLTNELNKKGNINNNRDRLVKKLKREG